MHEGLEGIKKGAVLPVDIQSLSFGGEGVAKENDFVIFVPGALPGQKAKVKIIRKKKPYAEATLLEVLTESPDVVSAKCPHFLQCGGCSLQHYSYEKQLEAKTTQVRDLLAHLGGISNPTVLSAIPSPQIFFYRNKMEFTFDDQPPFHLGFHLKKRFDKILPIDSCFLQSEESNSLLKAISSLVEKSSLPVYRRWTHQGFWRHVAIREGKKTGERMINFITADFGEDGKSEVQRITNELLKERSDVTTVVHTINRGKAEVATGEEVNAVFGPGFINEEILGFRFRISPLSFFQTNSLGAERLFQVVEEFAGLSGGETVVDGYCGTGAISVCLSRKAKQIIGIELLPDAIKDAKSNADLNGVKNCSFQVVDFKDFDLHEINPSILILDPPRSGLHPKVVYKTANSNIPRILYVSCNPSTLARDAKDLVLSGYSLEKVQPVDLFPHTGHIELIALFGRETVQKIGHLF